MRTEHISIPELRRGMYLRLLIAIPVMALIFFWPAGTFDYWEAWVYLAILMIPAFYVVNYLLEHSPDLLVRRMRMQEKEAPQVRIIQFSIVYYLLTFLLPGFDRRFGWSDVPVWGVLIADLIVLLGYGIIILVFRENRYTGRTVQVDAGQTVISSGPYAVVRHPMYVGVVLMYGLSPLALGSIWALIPALLIIPILVARISNEEEVLQRDLKGYTEYMGRVKYRLIPGVW
jgi:protein-S-isoprenylcysteine O-methyltransferase Ste14